jgi:hypothetical protein
LAEGRAVHIFSAARTTTGETPVSEVSAFSELPLGPGWSVVGSTFVEQREDIVRSEARVLGKAGAAIGGAALAIQGGVVGADGLSDGSSACQAWGGEAAGLAGFGWSGPAAGFVSLEAGYRDLGEGCAGVRSELALGVKPHPSFLLLGQVFHDAAAPGPDALKLQGSVVVFSEGGIGVQLGARMRLDGAAREPALTVGIWRGP